MVVKPTINLKGTAPRVLLDLHLKAIDTLRYAISTLQSAEPGARDYQTARLVRSPLRCRSTATGCEG